MRGTLVAHGHSRNERNKLRTIRIFKIRFCVFTGARGTINLTMRHSCRRPALFRGSVHMFRGTISKG